MTVTEQHLFVTEHSTLVRIDKMAEQVRDDVTTLVDATIKYNNLQWVDGHGGGGGHFPGLDEKLTRRLESENPRRPVCGADCTLSQSVRTDGTGATTRVVTQCSSRKFATRHEAERQQLDCETAHAAVPGYLRDELHAHASNIRFHEHELEKAEAELERCKRNLADYS